MPDPIAPAAQDLQWGMPTEILDYGHVDQDGEQVSDMPPGETIIIAANGDRLTAEEYAAHMESAKERQRLADEQEAEAAQRASEQPTTTEGTTHDADA